MGVVLEVLIVVVVMLVIGVVLFLFSYLLTSSLVITNANLFLVNEYYKSPARDAVSRLANGQFHHFILDFNRDNDHRIL